MTPASSRPRTWRIGRFGGVDVLIRPSLIVIVVVLIIMFQSRFSLWAASNAYVLSAVLVVFLYVSVLVHEFAHTAVARRLDYRVGSITLHFFGGETEIDGESRRPSDEFWIAVAGPLSSLGIALLAAAVALPLTGDLEAIAVVAAWLNVLLAIVNLLPGLPLDGGRVLRAPLWALLDDRARATLVTAWIGRGLAVLLVAAAYGLYLLGSTLTVVDVAIAAVVAVFLWIGATASLDAARRDQRLDRLSVAELMDPSAADEPGLGAVGVELRGAALLRMMVAHPADRYRVVDSDGRPVGIVRAADVESAYRRAAP